MKIRLAVLRNSFFEKRITSLTHAIIFPSGACDWNEQDFNRAQSLSWFQLPGGKSLDYTFVWSLPGRKFWVVPLTQHALSDIVGTQVNLLRWPSWFKEPGSSSNPTRSNSITPSWHFFLLPRNIFSFFHATLDGWANMNAILKTKQKWRPNHNQVCCQLTVSPFSVFGSKISRRIFM